MRCRNSWALALVVLTTTWATAEPPTSPPADVPPESSEPSVLKVEAGKARLDGKRVLAKSMAEAREVLAQTRDYTGFLVRQERVSGVLRPEQVAELRVRAVPRCVNVRVVKPAALRGEETSFMADAATHTVRFKPAGVEGVRGFQTQLIDAPKVMAHTSHRVSEVGLVPLLDRIDAILATEQSAGQPAVVTASEYVFNARQVMKCELFADRAHPRRYAAKVAIYFDKETKLPVRLEAFDGQSQLVESHSYVGVKRNVGLGDAAFER